MKKEWKKLEGAQVRFDVGSSATQALAEGFPAEVICFTTDGNIVFNGIQYSLSQDEYNALVEAIKANKEAIAANAEAIANKVDKKEGYTLASERQLYVADWCDTHILTGNSAVAFLKAMDGGDKGIALSHALDGDTYHTDTYIPLATDTAAGVMSAEDHNDLTTAKEDIEQLFEMADESDKKVAANTEAIAANAEAIKACQDSIANAGNSNKSLLQISTSLVLPIGGTDPFRVSVEGIAKNANWAEAYGTFPIYNTALNAFLINAGLKNYAAWVGYTDIPDSSAYGSTKTLYYDGTKLYRYTGQELVELTSSGTSDTTALENRVKTLEAQLASVMSLLTLQQ